MTSALASAVYIETETEPIKLIVGKDDERTFFVHENTLRRTSLFFDAALREAWKEGQERLIRLPEDNADHIKLYIDWLYTGQTVPDKSSDSIIYAQLFSLGTKFLDSAFQNHVIDVITNCVRASGNTMFPDIAFVREIYDNTSNNSPARWLMVDSYARQEFPDVPGYLENNSGTVPYDFLMDLSCALLRYKSLRLGPKDHSRESEGGVGCLYHTHENDKRCGGKGQDS